MSYNEGLAHHGDIYTPRRKMPKPKWRDEEFSFRMNNIISYYIENKGDRDIIINLAGDGIVRFVWEPNLVASLEAAFSHC